MTADSAIERFGFIDIARFYAMVLVFYGHFIEELMLLNNPAAAGQYKFIYSFHMLLFPLTTIAGCALIILIAGMTRTQKTIVWLGQNTFILI